jgi:hypothetical protein
VLPDELHNRPFQLTEVCGIVTLRRVTCHNVTYRNTADRVWQ